MTDPIFDELAELIPNEGRRVEWMLEAGLRAAADDAERDGYYSCMRCGKRTEDDMICCDACMDCQQCYHPKATCLCKNENFLKHLRYIIDGYKAENTERVRNNGWKIQ